VKNCAGLLRLCIQKRWGSSNALTQDMGQMPAALSFYEMPSSGYEGVYWSQA
jgi:hypothetical protein